MSKSNLRKLNKKIGLPPGALVYTGIPREGKTEITLISYDQEIAEKFTSEKIGEIVSTINENRVNWINIDSLHNVEVIEETGRLMNIHSLLLEDILDVEHQPKIEEHENFLFFTLKMLEIEPPGADYIYDHVSFVLGKNYLLCFQEGKGDPFDLIRERIASGKGRVRSKPADYLFLLLLDAIVDQYFIILEKINLIIARIEIEMYENPSEETVNRIIIQKKELNSLRENIYPVADGLKMFRAEESEFITEDNLKYYNDIGDHLKQIVDSINNQREALSSLMEFYMIRISNQMNQVMKTLTIIATIFIPLTFIVGIYGMNFHFMPELYWKWSYPLLLVFMLIGGLGWYIYMRKRKWF